MLTDTLEKTGAEAAPTYTLPDGSTVIGPWKQGRYYTYKSNDGSLEYLLRIDKKGDPAEVITNTLQATEKVAEKSASTELVTEAMNAARAFIEAELAKPLPNKAKYVEHNGIKFWIRQTAFNEQMAQAVRIGREVKPDADSDTEAALSIDNPDHVSALAAGAMHLACVCGETDFRPLFKSYEEALRLAQKPGCDGLATALFGAVWGENPDIVKNLMAG